MMRSFGGTVILLIMLQLAPLATAGTDKPGTGIHGSGAGAYHDAKPEKFDPDNDPDAITHAKLAERFGAIPKPRKKYKIGAVLKFFGNPFWQLLAKGMESRVNDFGLSIDVRAGATESDPEGQLAMMNEMVLKNYDVLLISPQTDQNLKPAVEKARKQGILLINVDDAVLDDAEHFVGPNQFENGMWAARYFIDKYHGGGQVAVIKGLDGVYAVHQRTKGFVDTLRDTPFDIVAQVHGDWDMQKSLEKAGQILKQYPDIKGFYCNNDIMALGAAYAAKFAGKSHRLVIIGTDGIEPAYQAIRADEMTGTVDAFPYQIGLVAIEVALRLLGGQKVPRVVYSPQNLVTKDNVNSPLPRRFSGGN